MERTAEASVNGSQLSAVAALKARPTESIRRHPDPGRGQDANHAAGENPRKRKKPASDDRPEETRNVQNERSSDHPLRNLRLEDSKWDALKSQTFRAQKDSDTQTEEDSDSQEQGDSDGQGFRQTHNAINIGEITHDEDDSSASESISIRRFDDRRLSSIHITKQNVAYSSQNALSIRMLPQQTLVVIGQYDLWVKRGVVSIMGAELPPSPTLHRVFAPATHSLPSIRCVAGASASGPHAEIEISSVHNRIRFLKVLSPLFGRIWNDKRTTAESVSAKEHSKKRSFSVIYSSSDDPQNRHLQPLILDSSWGSTITTFSQAENGRIPKILTCGPKASGKSTFNRYLLNHMLSEPLPMLPVDSCRDGVAFLDLDPGQPEFTPSGQVSLAHIQSPFFGPPFCHPLLSTGGQLIRSHHIGAITPKDDPEHYKACARDLINHYHILLQTHPSCPLIVNCSGWVFGVGLEILTEFINALGTTDVVYLSSRGPIEVTGPLLKTANSVGIPMQMLPSQPTEFANRSAAQLRAMQMASYFHLAKPQGANLRWDELPLTIRKPLTVGYAGAGQGILGIMILGARQDPDFVYDAIDGSLVAVVILEDDSAISPHPEADPLHDNDMISENGSLDEENGVLVRCRTNSPMSKDGTDYARFSPSSAKANHKAVFRTQRGNLPYLFSGPGSCSPLDPSKSHCLGLAFVRSIDVESQTLELITPISETTIHSNLQQGHKVVLVRGKLDCPDWAYSEEHFMATAAERRARRRKDEQDDVGEAERGARWEGKLPWAKILDRPEGRGHGKKVWRVISRGRLRDSDADADMSD